MKINVIVNHKKKNRIIFIVTINRSRFNLKWLLNVSLKDDPETGSGYTG